VSERALDPAAATPRRPAASVRAARQAAVGALLALIALGLAWELWLAPTGRGTLALKVLPLALALPGLLAYRLYTCRWLSLLVWLYVAEGLVRATSSGGGVTAALAWGEVALGLLLFGACALQVRLRLAGATAATGA
jgi:uncharacterized membrane protein